MAAGDSEPNVKTGSSNTGGRRAAARLAAVQALYQIEITGLAVDQAIAQFLAGEAPRTDIEDGPVAVLPAPDPELFAAIVGGVVAHRDRLDEIIGAALSIAWTVARLEILVRLILEAGVFELTFRDDIPPNVSINEYVNVANAFFDGAEPGLINGVLDSVAGPPVAGPSGAGPVTQGGA
jgi:N utilization substance protein B